MGVERASEVIITITEYTGWGTQVITKSSSSAAWVGWNDWEVGHLKSTKKLTEGGHDGTKD